MQGDRCYAIHAPYPHFDVEYEFPVRTLENAQVNCKARTINLCNFFRKLEIDKIGRFWRFQ